MAASSVVKIWHEDGIVSAPLALLRVVEGKAPPPTNRHLAILAMRA